MQWAVLAMLMCVVPLSAPGQTQDEGEAYRRRLREVKTFGENIHDVASVLGQLEEVLAQEPDPLERARILLDASQCVTGAKQYSARGDAGFEDVEVVKAFDEMTLARRAQDLVPRGTPLWGEITRSLAFKLEGKERIEMLRIPDEYALTMPVEAAEFRRMYVEELVRLGDLDAAVKVTLETLPWIRDEAIKSSTPTMVSADFLHSIQHMGVSAALHVGYANWSKEKRLKVLKQIIDLNRSPQVNSAVREAVDYVERDGDTNEAESELLRMLRSELLVILHL